MNNCAVIVRLGEVRKHLNADKLCVTTIFGNQVIVGTDVKPGDLGVYFEAGLQLGEEFAKANDLIRRKNPVTGLSEGGMFDENRRVRAQKLRGQISDGFWMPISCLNFLEIGMVLPEEGMEFTALKDTEICTKYIPRGRESGVNRANQTKTKKKVSIMFKEHYDTMQLGRNLDKIKGASEIVITEKLHGTSQRVGYVQIESEQSWLDKLFTWLNRNIRFEHTKTVEWKYLNGTRRVVLSDSNAGTGYHDDNMRVQAAEWFQNKLHPGETVYFEVVGYEPSSKPIMPIVSTTKLNDKTIQAQYPQNMIFSYGCNIGQHKVYVYRMTTTSIDGTTVDYSWDDIVSRCEEIGVSTVPLLFIGSVDYNVDLDSTEDIAKAYLTLADSLSKGPSTLDSAHIKEGVCVIVKSGLHPVVLKHKSFEFKVLEGIIKDEGIVDQEEQENVSEG